MRCGKCGGENLPGAKFCKFCGSTLEGEMWVDSFVTPPPRTDLTTGCKVWFWIMLVSNVVSAISGIMVIPVASVIGIEAVISGIVLAASSYLIMFKHMKGGLYAIIAMALINFIVSLIYFISIGVFSGILLLVEILEVAVGPALSYYFVNSNADIIK